MNAPLHPSAFSSPLGTEQGLRRQAAGLAAKALATVLVLVSLTGTSLAIDQPPDTAPRQRAWLLSHLVTDMQSVGSFHDGDFVEVAPRQRPDRRPGQPSRPVLLPDPSEDRAGRPALCRPAERHRGSARPGESRKSPTFSRSSRTRSSRRIRNWRRSIPAARPCARSPTPPFPVGAPTTGTPSPTGTTATAATSGPSSRQVTAARTPSPSTARSTIGAAATTGGTAGRTSTTTSRESLARTAVRRLRERDTRIQRQGTSRHRPRDTMTGQPGRSPACTPLPSTTQRCQ